MLALPAQRLDTLAQRVTRGMQANSAAHAARFVRRRAARLTPTALQARLGNAGKRLDGLAHSGAAAGRHAVEQQAARIGYGARQLKLLSHESVLERGFALVLDAAGRPLRTAAQVAAGSLLDIRLAADDSVAARFGDGWCKPGPQAAPKTAAKTRQGKKPAKPAGDDGQGQLL